MIYAYDPACLLEPIGLINAEEFSLKLHNQAAIVGILANKNFIIRGDAEEAVQYIVDNNTLPHDLAFQHPEISDMFLVYQPENEELDVIVGTHPDMGEHQGRFDVKDILQWNTIDDEQMFELIMDMCGYFEDVPEEDELVDALQECLPLTGMQRIQLANLIGEFLQQELQPEEEQKPEDDTV